MSYNKMMKWNRVHRKGTRQPVIMHTNSGFWPSKSFLDKYFDYRERCEAKDANPADCEYYYNNRGECENALNS